MHVTRCLEEGDESDTHSSSQEQHSISIAEFGKLYNAVLLTHGEVVSMSLLNHKGVFRKSCGGLTGKQLMSKVHFNNNSIQRLLNIPFY